MKDNQKEPQLDEDLDDAPEENLEAAQEEDQENQEEKSEKDEKDGEKSSRWEDILLAVMLVLGFAVICFTAVTVAGSILLNKSSEPSQSVSAANSASEPEYTWMAGETKSTFSVMRDKGLLSGYPLEGQSPAAGAGTTPAG